MQRLRPWPTLGRVPLIAGVHGSHRGSDRNPLTPHKPSRGCTSKGGARAQPLPQGGSSPSGRCRQPWRLPPWASCQGGQYFLSAWEASLTSTAHQEDQTKTQGADCQKTHTLSCRSETSQFKTRMSPTSRQSHHDLLRSALLNGEEVARAMHPMGLEGRSGQHSSPGP